MASHGVPRVAIIGQPGEKTEQARLKVEKDIEEYKGLVDLIDAKIKERQYTLEVLELTSRLLKKNPEYYTIWNIRRKILLQGLLRGVAVVSSENEDVDSCTPPAPETHLVTSPGESLHTTILDVIRTDLDFILPLMIGWPKCYWIWKYRLWLLEEGNNRLAIAEARELWQRELSFVSKMLTRDHRNFHGWGYRRMVVAQLESQQLQGQSMIEAEFEYTTRMINLSLRNFSAWHNRSKLIPKLLDERRADDKTRLKFLDNEFDLIMKAIYTDEYPYDQSVWFYHQFLMTTLTDSKSYAAIAPNFTAEQRVEYVNRQIESVKDFLDGGEDCKWAYGALIDANFAVYEMQRRLPTALEAEDLKKWISEVRKLDGLRTGRWDDLERTLLATTR